MDTNGSMRPRASTMPDRLLKKPKGGKQRGPNMPNDRSSENRAGSYEKIHLDVPNGMRSPRSPTPDREGYSTEGPKHKPRTMSKLAVPETNGPSQRRRGSFNNVSPNPTGLLKPPSNEASRARRKSCPSISPRPVLSPSKVKSPAIRIESPRPEHDSLNNSPKSVWDEIDETIDKPVNIQRDPLPGGSPEFRRCMTQIESLDIHDKHQRPRRLSADWQPKIKVIQAEEPESPRTPRRVRWLDVS